MIVASYVTGNASKFQNAAAFFRRQGMDIAQEKLRLNEIQASAGEEVALHKARDAFELIHQPLFVNDASWSISALNGFPGPYMKYIVSWFSAEDILDLMQHKDDRTVILRDIIVYKDHAHEKVFVNEVRGAILRKPDEIDYDGPYIDRLISLSGDGKSIAAHNTAEAGTYTESELRLWDGFAGWLKIL